MATDKKVIEFSNRIKSIKSSDDPAVNHIVAGADDIYDDEKGKKQSEVNAETDATLAEHTSTINGLNSQNYVTVTATDQTTAVTDVLPATGEVATVYRVGNWDGSQYDETCYSEYSWNGSAYVHLSTKTQIGEVFDISAYHATGGTLATYADLSAALGTNGANIPESLRKGGMSIKFVHSVDNKYVQYRYIYSSTAAADFANTNNWIGETEDIIVKENLLKSRGVFKELLNYRKAELQLCGLFIANHTTVQWSNSTYDGILFYVPKGYTKVYYSGMVAGTSGGFTRVPKVGDTKEVDITIDGTNCVATLSSNDNGLWVIMDITLSSQPEVFNPQVWIKTQDRIDIETLQVNSVNTNNKVSDLEVEVICNRKLSGIYTKSVTGGRKVDYANSTYNSIVVYIPSGITTFNYDGLVAGSVDGFTNYPKVGDYSEFRCTVNATQKTISIPSNENGWYILIDVIVASQPSPFNPKVYIPGTLVSNVHNLELLIPDISTLSERVDNLSAKANVSKMFNIPSDLKKAELKILMIGNSYTGNMVEYLSALCSNIGNNVSDLAIYRIYQGSSGFTTWVNNYNNNANTTCSKVVGNLDLQLPEGTSIIGDSVPFRDILSLVRWDIIFIQQVSTYATDYDTWLGTGTGGNLIEYVRILKKTNPQATIGYILPHSYKDDYSGNTEHSSLLRWEKIADASEKLKANFGIDLIIPYGTAVENLRSTTLNQDDFSADGTHLATGLGMYAAACCCYELLLAPRFGTSMIGNTLRYPSATYPVTNANAEPAQMAALYACCDMFTNNPPDID